MISVLSFPDKFTRAYPKHPADEAKGVPCNLGTLFSPEAALESDVHFSAYSSDLPCRLSKLVLEAEYKSAHPSMCAAVFDIDDPVAHAAAMPASPEWWADEKSKISRLSAKHPNPFVYRSRGGYRIVFALPEYRIQSLDDAAAWKSIYLAWIKYLGRSFDIRADRACADWTRLFRAPFVTRDGVAQALETIGDPHQIGKWAPALSAADLKPDRKTRLADQRPHEGGVEPVPIRDIESAYGLARLARAAEYLESTAPLSIKGDGGRSTMFTVCVVLVVRMRLPIDLAAQLIEDFYNPRLAAAGTDTWSASGLSTHGMSIVERLNMARTTSSVPPGNVLDEETWSKMQLGGVW